MYPGDCRNDDEARVLLELPIRSQAQPEMPRRPCGGLLRVTTKTFPRFREFLSCGFSGINGPLLNRRACSYIAPEAYRSARRIRYAFSYWCRLDWSVGVSGGGLVEPEEGEEPLYPTLCSTTIPQMRRCVGRGRVRRRHASRFSGCRLGDPGKPSAPRFGTILE